MVEARAGAAYEVEPDFASRQAIISGVIWLVIAVTVGLGLHLLLLFPGLGAAEFLSYGRVRAVYDTVTIFGWLTTIGFAAVFALLPRLAMAQLHNEVLGGATVVFWNMLLFVGIATLLVGMSQGRPLAELPFGVDVALLVMLLLVLYNGTVTVVRRRERTLYASAWYLLAAILLFPLIYLIGNLPVFAGMTDAIVSGFYVNAVEFLWLVPIGLAIAYYVIPVDTGNPLFSTVIARTGFWTLLFAGGWAGHRFFVKGPGPDYLEPIAVGMTIVLLVPILAAATNLLITGRERWGLLGRALGLRFAVTGLVLLVLWTVLVVVGTLPMVARFVGLTAWHSGLRHLAVFGAFSFLAFGLVYHIYPLLVGRDWNSRPAAAFHYWATLIGVLVGSGTLFAAGAVQGAFALGAAQLAGAQAFGEVAQVQVLLMRSFQVVTAAAFGLVAVAQYVFAVNAWYTTRRGPLLQITQPAAVRAGSAA